MQSTPFLIDCLLNNSFYVKPLIDTGCLCYSVIDENLVHTHNLETHAISDPSLRLADGKYSKISKIACLYLEIDGHHEKLWGYVMPQLAYPIILSKTWMEKNNVVYISRRRCIRFGTRGNGMTGRENGWYENKSPKSVQEQIAHVLSKQCGLISEAEFNTILNKELSKDFQVAAVSVNDVTRALQSKPSVIREEIEQNLPPEIRHHFENFMDDNKINSDILTPHRPGVDMKIVLKRDELGREIEVPWGPLHGMSRGELLVLRKTLLELTNKI